MSIERVRKHFEELGIADRILEFPVSSATVELAAEAVGVIPARIAKTLSFKLDERVILVVTAGDARVDNKKYKAQFGGKARMLPMEETVPLIGHAVGGVCPFAVNEGVEVYADISMKRFDTVFPACGSSNSAIEISCEELDELAKPIAWVDVCKDWQ
ncbi:MAG: YbaK/EbsC family protein [Ruminococcaceae bacterium]|nr:YbaK/EbsC family protein [Oscillospiraceae bacterium]